jgi:hypothetical protein
MKAGKYYVGDLCYVFNDEDWNQICKIIIDGHSCLEGEFNLPDGRRFAIFNTAWGDGEYEDQNGHSYSVDAGSIGCTLVDNISADKYEDLTQLGNIVEFKEDFNVYEKDYIIHIGHLKIDTDPIFDEDNEDYDEEVFEDWDKD